MNKLFNINFPPINSGEPVSESYQSLSFEPCDCENNRYVRPHVNKDPSKSWLECVGCGKKVGSAIETKEIK